MRFIFVLAAVYCSVIGLFMWFFPEQLIRFNDWLTEKTLRHEKAGTVYRIIFGALFLGIGLIFWWVIFS